MKMKATMRIKIKNLWLLCCGGILSLALAACTTYNGKQLFRAEGCITCHRFKGTGGSMGPDLTAITQIKSDSVIAAYMKNPGQYNQQSRMPSYSHLSRAKRKAIISFLKN